ncbi:uncharacterized protein LOC119728379 isoform X1 [Patiria miniata]|uniref:Uncharacterized protein n=2 Tax=Patiria miniata TaxID=46514 RepID=A0A913ZXZ9_PATMI|nr:uncharacterized protein LOC119728379 isoform X1 [Patiria miniata]
MAVKTQLANDAAWLHGLSMDIFRRLHVAVALSPDNLNRDSKTGLLFIVAMIFALAGSSCALEDGPLTIQVEHSVVQVNTTLQLNCTFTNPGRAATNATDITWTRDGEPITKANTRVEVVGSSQLILDRVQFDDSGVYACRLDDGSLPSTVTIQVGLPPAKITDLRCYSRNFMTAHCSWTNGPDTNLPTSHQLLWKEYCYDDVFMPCNMTVCDLRDLDSACFTVNSSNALDHTKSDQIPFKRDEIVLNPPRLTAVTAKSESALLIKWQPPVDYGDYPTAVQNHLNYQLRCEYKDSNSSWQKCSPATTVAEVCKFCSIKNLIHPSYDLGSLSQPYGLYRISLRGKAPSAKHWSDWSNIKLGRTSEAAPLSGVSLGLTCIAVNKTATAVERDVQLFWQPLPEYKMNGLVLYYVINVNGSLFNATGNSSSHLERGLNPYEYYQISIVGFNSVGATDEDTCEVHPMPAVVESSTPVVAGIIVATLLFIVCIIVLVYAWQRVKKSMVHIPDIRLPNYIQTDNLYTYGGPHRGPIREKESYDELINSTLFVDLTPESDSCDPCCNGVMTNGFVIDKGLSKEPILEPLENRRKHPLLSARRTNSLVNENYSLAPTEQEALLSDDPFLPEVEPDKCEEPSGDYSHHYGGWKDSALSIRSGGSYMHLREEDAASYSNMTDGGLTPISEDGQRVGKDRLGDAQETRPESLPQDGANRPDLEQLPRDVSECPYTVMGIGNVKGGSGNLSQHPGFPENDGHGSSYIDMKRKESQELRDQPRQNLPGSQHDPKSLSDSHPCAVDDKSLEAAQDDPCNTLGNYVQQGLFLSPSPKLPSSRSGSPRPNPSGRTTPRLLESCSPTQPRGDTDPTENPVQGLPGHSRLLSPPNQSVEAPSSLDSPDSSQDDIQPYVLNTCVLSGSAEPLLANPLPDAASPQPVCESHPSQDSDCSSSVSLSNGDSLSESTPLMLNDSDVSERSSPSDEEGRANQAAVAGGEPGTGSSTANGEGGYITVGQLPPPASASAANGDKCANPTVDDGPYVTPDQLQSLTKASSAADSGTGDTSCNGEIDSEMGSYVSPDEVAKWAVPKAANTKCNGLKNDASHDTNSDYVTEAQLREMIKSSTKDAP